MKILCSCLGFNGTNGFTRQRKFKLLAVAADTGVADQPRRARDTCVAKRCALCRSPSDSRLDICLLRLKGEFKVYGVKLHQNLTLLNDEVLAVNQNSTNNRQLFNTNDAVVWIAHVPESKDKYVALFNTLPAPVPRPRRSEGAATPAAPTNAGTADPTATQPRDISVSLTDLGFSGSVKVWDLWNHKDLGVVSGSLTQPMNSHGAGLYRVQPQG